MRASQISGCAYCIDMHAKDARAEGETGHVPDSVYEHARKNFSEEELVNLAMAIITINGWNRLSITFRSVPGEYQPGKK